MEVDHSFGALLITCGLCTVPDHGEPCSTGAVRRRRAGDAKGLSRSGVNGAVKGLCGLPTTERLNTEAGVFISKVGLWNVRSSVPESTFKINRAGWNDDGKSNKPLTTLFVFILTYMRSQTMSSFHSQWTLIWPFHWLLQCHDRLQVSGSDQPAETDTPCWWRSSYEDGHLWKYKNEVSFNLLVNATWIFIVCHKLFNTKTFTNGSSKDVLFD